MKRNSCLSMFSNERGAAEASADGRYNFPRLSGNHPAEARKKFTESLIGVETKKSHSKKTHRGTEFFGVRLILIPRSVTRRKMPQQLFKVTDPLSTIKIRYKYNSIRKKSQLKDGKMTKGKDGSASAGPSKGKNDEDILFGELRKGVGEHLARRGRRLVFCTGTLKGLKVTRREIMRLVKLKQGTAAGSVTGMLK